MYVNPVQEESVGVGSGVCVAVRLGEAVCGCRNESIRIADEPPPD
jgi:hypothetical protein